MQEEDRAAAAEAAQEEVPGLPGPQHLHLVGAPTQEEVTAVLTLVIIEAIMFL